MRVGDAGSCLHEPELLGGRARIRESGRGRRSLATSRGRASLRRPRSFCSGCGGTEGCDGAAFLAGSDGAAAGCGGAGCAIGGGALTIREDCGSGRAGDGGSAFASGGGDGGEVSPEQSAARSPPARAARLSAQAAAAPQRSREPQFARARPALRPFRAAARKARVAGAGSCAFAVSRAGGALGPPASQTAERPRPKTVGAGDGAATGAAAAGDAGGVAISDCDRCGADAAGASAMVGDADGAAVKGCSAAGGGACVTADGGAGRAGVSTETAGES